jgi:hypothetical protein
MDRRPQISISNTYKHQTLLKQSRPASVLTAETISRTPAHWSLFVVFNNNFSTIVLFSLQTSYLSYEGRCNERWLKADANSIARVLTGVVMSGSFSSSSIFYFTVEVAKLRSTNSHDRCAQKSPVSARLCMLTAEHPNPDTG